MPSVERHGVELAALRTKRARTPSIETMPLAFSPSAPSPTVSPSDRTFVPVNAAASPVTRAKPMLSFCSVRGSKPYPSPYAAYSASSAPHVIGQLSEPGASHRISSTGANSIPVITVLSG